MKEHPILFSGPMIRAILDGRKTQTRRVVKAPVQWAIGSDLKPLKERMMYDLERARPDHGFPTNEDGTLAALDPDLIQTHPEMFRNHYLHVPFAHPHDGWNANPDHDTRWRVYPPWQHGDRLWVRETWRRECSHPDNNTVCLAYRASQDEDKFAVGITTVDNIPLPSGVDMRTSVDTRWRSALYIPRWASRITLLVKSVRVERLQEISEADAIAEGIERRGVPDLNNPERRGWMDYSGKQFNTGPGYRLSPILSYKSLWDSINAKKHPWASNPWVWVVEFERVKP